SLTFAAAASEPKAASVGLLADVLAHWRRRTPASVPSGSPAAIGAERSDTVMPRDTTASIDSPAALSSRSSRSRGVSHDSALHLGATEQRPITNARNDELPNRPISSVLARRMTPGEAHVWCQGGMCM